MQLRIIGLTSLESAKEIIKIIKELGKQTKKAIKLQLYYNNNEARPITYKKIRDIIIEAVTKAGYPNLIRTWANVAASPLSNNEAIK